MREIFITSSVLILAILLIRTLAKGKINPCIQYTLWLLVVIRLVLPMPLWNSRFSIMNLFPEALLYDTEEAAGDGMNFDAIRADGRADLRDVGKTGVNLGEYESEYADNLEGLDDEAVAYAPEELDNGTGVYNSEDADGGTRTYNSEANNAAGADTVDSTVISYMGIIESDSYMKKVNNATIISALNIIREILPFIWITGVIMTGGYMLIYQRKWKRYLLENRKPLDGMEIYKETLSVYTVESLPSPCLSGQGIYLTREMAEDKAELEHILAHEYCHYRQLDTVWVVVRCVLTVVYWFNPLVWVAAYVSKQDSELACDAAAIRLLGEDNRFAYGKTLVKLVSGTTHNKYMIGIASTMSGKEKGIKERIGMIAGKRKYIAAAAVAVLLIAVALVAVTFSGAGNGSGETGIDASETANAETGSEALEEGNGSETQADKKWVKVIVKSNDGSEKEYEGWVSSDYEGKVFYKDEPKIYYSDTLNASYSVVTVHDNEGSVYSITKDSEGNDVYIINDSETDSNPDAIAWTLKIAEEKKQQLTELEKEIEAYETMIKETETQMKEVEAEIKAAKEQNIFTGEEKMAAEVQMKAAEIQRKVAETQTKAAEIQRLISEMEADCRMLEDEKLALKAEIQAAEDALKDPSLNLLYYGHISSGNENISYVNPCPEYTRISDTYGSRIHPMTGIERMHYGIDLAAEKGADIVAAADGIVQETGFDTSNGNYVILCHISSGEFTYYTHCGDILVKKGDNVTEGEKIAEVGVSGNSTGPHLHFAVSKGGEYIEPVIEMK